MTNSSMTWRDFEPINTEEEFSKAVSRIMEEELPELGDLGVPETAFEALDKNVENEIARLTGDQVNAMKERWENGWTWSGLPESLYGIVDDWKGHLTISCVGAYCAASGAFIRSILLDASSSENEASGFIESPLQAPTLFVFAQPGSLLARDEGFKDSGVGKRFGPSQFAHRIALRCGEQLPWGELAWRFLVASFVKMDVDNVLPRLTVRQTGAGRLMVEL